DAIFGPMGPESINTSRRFNERSTMKSRSKIAAGAVTVVAVVAVAAVAMNHGPDTFAGRLLDWVHGQGREHKQTDSSHRTPRIEIVPDHPDTIRFTDEAYKTVGIHTVEVEPAPPPDPLRLPGSLQLDPN